MALQYKESIYFHIPRTAGRYIRTMIRKNKSEDVVVHERGLSHCLPSDIANIVELHRFYTYAFVRMPETWIQSYWALRMATEFKHNHFIDRRCKTPDFNKFVMKYVQVFPFGYLSSIIAQALPYLSQIWMFENMEKDKEYLFERIGLNITEEVGIINSSNNEFRKEAVFKDETLEALRKAESTIYNLYYPNHG